KLMQEKEHTLSKKCRLGDAFRYIRKHWAALCNFCDDGLAEVDNNAAERALRAVCLGKKNYVFFGSDHGGERGALLYGLIGTRSEEHTSELQSRFDLVCRLLLEKKKRVHGKKSQHISGELCVPADPP